MNAIIFTYDEAYKSAIAYLDLGNNDPVLSEVKFDSGLYYIEISTLLMHYEFFVDSNTCEILGINSEPGLNHNQLYVYSFENKIPA